MYQAIVFLPLIGAIVAGLISLAGARARHPGGSAKDHKDHHAHPEPQRGGAAAHADAHAAAEPAAA
jgi:NADH-quinone oxidoreductase subunit L